MSIDWQNSPSGQYQYQQSPPPLSGTTASFLQPAPASQQQSGGLSQQSTTPIKRIDKYQFSLTKCIGSGSYANVYLGENTLTNETVAIKMIDKAQIASETYLMNGLAQEIAVMKKLNSDYIVRLIDVLETKNNYYIVQEYCDQGDFRSFLSKHKSLSEAEAKQVLLDLLSGFLELLKHGIIHRDLKPENILISSKKPQGKSSEQSLTNRHVFKLADFGFSRTLDNFRRELLNSLVGTPLYMSPQILTSQKYTSKSDIWSIGVIFYEMVYGKRPWTGNSLYALIDSIKSGAISWNHPEKGVIVSDLAKDFMFQCLQIEEAKRIEWDMMYAHRFFGEHFSHFLEKNKNLEDKALCTINSLRLKIHSTQTNIEELFSRFALAKSSRLAFKELEALLKQIDSELNREEIEFIFNTFDSDGDNTIDFSEFQKWLQVHNVLYSNEDSNNCEIPPNSSSLEQLQFQQQKFAQQQQQQQYQAKQQQINYSPPPNHMLEGVAKDKIVQANSQQNPQKTTTTVTKDLNDRALIVVAKLRFAIEQFSIDVRELFNRYDKKKQNSLILEQFMRMIKKIDDKLLDEEISKAFLLFNPDPVRNSITFEQFSKVIIEIKNSVSLSIRPKQIN